jgi:transcriptional regulator with XRE-family HTH domain
MPKQNIVGPQVRKLRVARGWSQEELAGQLQQAGWQIMRGTLAKIEAQVRCVSDAELIALSRALRVPVERLFAHHEAV